jgi:hypothetical protein
MVIFGSHMHKFSVTKEDPYVTTLLNWTPIVFDWYKASLEWTPDVEMLYNYDEIGITCVHK